MYHTHFALYLSSQAHHAASRSGVKSFVPIAALSGGGSDVEGTLGSACVHTHTHTRSSIQPSLPRPYVWCVHLRKEAAMQRCARAPACVRLYECVCTSHTNRPFPSPTPSLYVLCPCAMQSSHAAACVRAHARACVCVCVCHALTPFCCHTTECPECVGPISVTVIHECARMHACMCVCMYVCVPLPQPCSGARARKRARMHVCAPHAHPLLLSHY